MLNPLTHLEAQITGGEASSKLPKFRGQRLLKVSHITT